MNHHIHLLATAWVNNPPMEAKEGENWLHELVEIVDMQILLNAKAIFCEDLGNEGVTGVVGLTTSHASFHSWHDAEHPFVSFDLYSCRSFSKDDVLEHLKKWGLIKCRYMLVDRDPRHDDMVILDQGTYIA